jgi:sugar transferase (PEP-CTERM/EpsH1 system associated)
LLSLSFHWGIATVFNFLLFKIVFVFMKILFAANRFPYPPYRGDKLKIYNLTKRLCKDHDLHLLTFLEDRNDLQHLPALDGIFKSIHLVVHPKLKSYVNVLSSVFGNIPFQVSYFSSRKMKNKVDQLLREEQFDAVHVQHLRMAQYFAHHREVPRILDLPDAYSLYWKRRIDATTGLKKIFNAAEFKRIKNYESILNQFDQTLVCSREDKSWLETQQNIHNVAILPNGVDTSTYHSQAHNYENKTTILFTGNMDYAPNIDAVQYFAKEIFPLILEQHPHVQFVIAGQRPVDAVKALESNKILVTGFVPNLREWYKEAAIVVAPLRFGAGTQNKVLEAMAMAVPVVSMNVGFQGLNIDSGEGVILAMDTLPFADACNRLLADQYLRKEVGEAGKQVIHSQFDWDVVAKKLENYLVGIAHKN